jgi:hypothetical protein
MQTRLLIAVCIVVPFVAHATDTQHGAPRKIARWHGWSSLHVVAGAREHNLADKLHALRRFARKWPEDTVLVFVDGYDVIVNNEPSKLETAFLATGKRLLISSEPGNAPRWPISGVVVGYAREIRRLLRMAWLECLGEDQHTMCHLMLDGSSIWARASIGIDHANAVACGVDEIGRFMFSNASIGA